MENTSLDLEKKQFKELLERTNELIVKQYDNLDTELAYRDYEQKAVESWFDEKLPDEGMDNDDLLNLIEKKVLNTCTNNLGPHMYAYVMSGGNQISSIAELLATTINQNATKWHLAPAMSEIEKRVIQWTTEIIGYSPKAGGVLVSGGSAANLTGLTVARNVFFEKTNIKEEGLFGRTPFTVYASDQVHSCVDKSVQVLGIGTKHLRKIATDAEYRIDTKKLEEQIKKDIANNLTPFCIVGIAGTVNTGAIDDLEALARLAKKYNMWYHIDGAYGVLACSLDCQKEQYAGLEKADSIALDFHKWLYQPFEAGCTIVRNWSVLKKSYFKKAEYLDTALEQGGNRMEFNEHSFQLSRNAKCFKVWMSLKSYGFKKIKSMIKKDLTLAKHLADKVRKASDFELNTISLAVVCFRYIGAYQTQEAITSINQRLIPALEQDGRVFITGTKLKGAFVIRACFINHRKTIESTDYLLTTIREVAGNLDGITGSFSTPL